ncbi:MAG TPA: substrate-binding domain-containing protein, partial [Kofleriaceae bacterium]|nr:substrate-binding domain-containing protein [Kofleriaceae bacterium]
MKPKTVIVIGFLIAVGVIVYAAVGRRTGGGAVPPATGAANPRGGSAADPGAQPGADVEITLEYSTEKKDWLEAAVGEFQRANPRIRVQLIGKGSLEAAGAILDGTDRPVLWSPADSLVANLLAADWKTKNQTALFPATGDTAPQPLVLTPLVFVVWEERARVLVDPWGGGGGG